MSNCCDVKLVLIFYNAFNILHIMQYVNKSSYHHALMFMGPIVTLCGEGQNATNALLAMHI